MKTRKHGNGLSHKEVVRFSNRLARFSNLKSSRDSSSAFGDAFECGWNAACKYFAHSLRVALRETEKNGLFY